ncbi:restriction endonuclease [Paracoccus sp. ME4]|uniref:restriction endonuclease n=1 Tax=Paracoccus sp. ME4 TaxID=3138066 RepID=UPI00398A5992
MSDGHVADAPRDRLWMVRPDRTAADERMALEDGMIRIDAGVRADISEAFEYEEVLDAVMIGNPGESGPRLESLARQTHALIHLIQPGDLAIAPMKRAGTIAIGQFLPGYAECSDGCPARQVKWLRTDIARDRVMPDLLYSLSARQRVARIERNDALERVCALLAGRPDPGPAGAAFTGLPDDGEELDRILRQRIAARVGSVFAGHGLAELVGEILRVQGFEVRVSPPGPDGGVDIYAGRGIFGMQDRVIVQVKSGDQRADHEVFQRLEGAMRAAKADRGLLVSWGGFTRPVLQRMDQAWYEVRLWCAADVIDALLEHYDRMPLAIRDRIPLRRVWA